MNAARVRIGNVRLKAGGWLRVLERPAGGRILEGMRAFVGKCAEYEEAPTAFVAIAYWPSPDEPWRPPYQLAWDTIDAALSTGVLMQSAAAAILAEGPTMIAQWRIMHDLGYRPVDDDPDDAA